MAISTETQDSSGVAAPLCNIVTPCGMLGYGFDEEVVDAELASLAKSSTPTAIILDSGSTDSGPEKLALGGMTVPRSSYKRDLAKILTLLNKYRVPLLFSSAGGDGSNDHVDEMVEVIREIVVEREQCSRLQVFGIYSEVAKSVVLERLAKGRIQGCGTPVPTLTPDDVVAASRIVSQMGYEPFLDTMVQNPDFDVIVGGRAYDPSPYVAYSMFQATAKSASEEVKVTEAFLGGIFHMGKILECGGSCATPKSKAVRATVYRDGTFDVKPLHPGTRCSPLSVAAYTLYEKSRPDLLYGPGGCLNLTHSQYEQLEDGVSVRVSGGVFHSPSTLGSKYTVKLEGACVLGYRTLFMGMFKDPILGAQIDSFLDQAREYVKFQHRHIPDKWDLFLHQYEVASQALSGAKGIFVVGEALAPTQELANSLASSARIASVHGPYPGQKATSGNFAMGIGGKLEIEMGRCANFCVYHLMELGDGEQGAHELKVQESEHENDVSTVAGPQPLYQWKKNVIEEKGRTATNEQEETNRVGTPQQQLKSPLAVLNSNGPSSTDPIPTTKTSVNGDAGPEKTLENGVRHTTLGDVARVIRSKNAGPFELTFDIMFESQCMYTVMKSSAFLTKAVISGLYSVPEEDIIYCGFFDPALAFKATIPRLRQGRRMPSGGFMEDDVHGSQMYVPLMELKLPKELVMALEGVVEHYS
ncbi:hypothetical protein LTR72_001805 [Exophiala xenobiotica]|nr:hypothetical protein LTR92_002750 [Exophiala xenobiotica]KAK5227922.1 hypothetical protein LTR72_001805 [Exophiala xenobiotica]KAK5285550.1 hypothetical protein LTR14_010824 [Exophiala xenobiotica]KAK5433687.1 hypothetical protein LTR18_010637 [Exophiala xenobiotica]KAK5480778.1 hypothetical protein LTR55_007281 [Exophiala xenobiotica]